jgi:serine/threonine-protein kinase
MTESTEPDEEKDSLLPGTIVGGKYKLVEPTGSGGMGSVWRAEHVTLESNVAIKFLHMSVLEAPSVRARFEREARLCAKLGDRSLHIVRVTDLGVADDGRPFLVMELLDGESLADRIEREGRLPLSVVSTIATQLCHALHVVHAGGIVHRDLKPANIFLCRGAGSDIHVKLIDFGVAKPTLDRNAPAMTREGFILGTPAYMSPEQITAQTADARSDLWGVVAIVYRALVGEPPFGNGSIGELGRRITKEPPTPPSKLVSDLPEALDAWVERGLSKKPDDRFQSTRALADALAKIAHEVPAKADAPRATERIGNLDSVETEAPTQEYRVTPPTGPLPTPRPPPEKEPPAPQRASSNRSRPARPSRPSRPSLRHAADPTEELDVSSAERAPETSESSTRWPIVLGAIALAAGAVYWAYRASSGTPQPTTVPSADPAATSSEAVAPFDTSSASAFASTTASESATNTASASASATTIASASSTTSAPPLAIATPPVAPVPKFVPAPIPTPVATFVPPIAPVTPPTTTATTAPPAPKPTAESELPSEYE